MRDLTKGPLPGHIVAMAVPIAVGMLVQTAYYMVDLYFVSRLGGAALAGVSAGGNIMFMVMGLTQTLSVGTIALVSHAVGREDQKEANLVFNQAAALAGFLGLSTLFAGIFGLGDRYLEAVCGDEETIASGSSYLFWFIPAMAMQFAIVAMNAALQGTGIVKPGMIVQMVTVLVNIILTPILVAGWGTGRPLGVAGAALGSAIAAFAGIVMMGLYFYRLERYVAFDFRAWLPRFDILRRLLGIGLPAGGEFVLLFTYMAVIYGVISDFGTSAQAGFGAGARVMTAVFLPAMAVAFAAPAIIGQNFGAKLASRVRGTFRTIAMMNVGIMLSVTVFCQLRPDLLVSPFSSDAEVLRVASEFMRIVSLNFVANGLSFTCSATFQGMGNTWPSLLSTSTRLVTFVGPALWLSGRPDFELEQVWYLSIFSVGTQAVVSLCLVAWQFRRRLDF